RVGVTWRPLDATLRTDPDGSVTPALTTNGLRLSGGGSGALATMTARGHSLGMVPSMALPAPTLSGPTATYASVLPGVDLVVTADVQGGFSEVFVIHDAKAAANPALRSLTFATRASGVSLSADAAGNLMAADARHQPIFTAPAPQMWDSALPAPSAHRTATAVDPRTGD